MGIKSWVAGTFLLVVIAACSGTRGDPDPGAIGRKAIAGAASALAAAGIPDRTNYGSSHWDHCSTVHASGWDPQSESLVFQTTMTAGQLIREVGRQLFSRGWQAGQRTSMYARWIKALADGREATVSLSEGRRDTAGPIQWSFVASVAAAHHPIPNCA